MKHQILALAVAALSFTACTNEDNISQDYLADTPIKLNVSVDEPTTRAGYSDADKPTGFILCVKYDIDGYDKYNYNVWAEWEDKNWKTYKLDQYYDYTTGKVTGIKEEVTMLWANMNDNVKITAMTVNRMSTGINKHPTDQTTLDALKNADILAMPTTEVKPTLSGINVEFKHTRSKINLTIELGSEYEFTKDDVVKKITDVKIDGSKVEAGFEIKSSTDNPQFIIAASGVPTPITPLYTGATAFSKEAGKITKASATYEAILIPQPFESGKFTVSFMVDGKTYAWTYDKELTLAPSTAYTLKLTAGNDKVQSASFSAAKWGAGNGDEGEKKETD